MVSVRAALAAAATLLSACAAAPKAPPSLPAMTPAGSITVFEGGCFYSASCDTYVLTLTPDGGYVLKRRIGIGGEAVSEGKAAGAFARVEALLRKANFATLPERMNGADASVWKPDMLPCIPHAPGLRITRATGAGDVREVYWDMGCRSAANSALLDKLRAAMNVAALN